MPTNTLNEDGELREQASLAVSAINAANSKFCRKEGPDYQAGDQLLQTAITHIKNLEQLISTHTASKDLLITAYSDVITEAYDSTEELADIYNRRMHQYDKDLAQLSPRKEEDL